MSRSVEQQPARRVRVARPESRASESQAELKAEVVKLRKINDALMEQVERSMDRRGNAFSLFQTATNLESQVRQRTRELSATLDSLEQSNMELKNAMERAEQANRSKTRFLAAASHDVLQPLNAALLLMSSLTTVQTSAEGTRLCRQVDRSLDTMDTLLRTLLYMSRLDAGDVRPDLQSVCLNSLFGSLASDFEPLARQKRLELRVCTGHLHVRSDPTMLRRILQNIIANAIRYTDRGGVLIIAGRCGTNVRIRVADTGRGIAREEFDNIFLEFHRGQSTETVHDADSAAGLGLGLAIVQRMISALDHDISLNSRVERGSCFQLAMPWDRTPARTAAAGAASPEIPLTRTGIRGTRILLIENDLVILQAMDNLLTHWGCINRLASSTTEALESLGKGQWQPDLVLADQQLNAGDLGMATIRRVRERVGLDVPAVLITADPSEELEQRAREAGVEMMSKPVKPAQLRALIAHLIQIRIDGGRRAVSASA